VNSWRRMNTRTGERSGRDAQGTNAVSVSR
jgi:hypothetical protein